MANYPSDAAFTDSVKKAQKRLGSREIYARIEQGKGWNHQITAGLKGIIDQADLFYFGTASADGQPYIQHRGAPPGFLHVLDDYTLAFADYFGNQQYISIGNLSENNKAIIFLMNYPAQQRIKIWGTAEFIEDDPDLIARLMPENYKAKPMRAIRFHVTAWDVNCKQHIRQRFTHEQVAPEVEQLLKHIAELEHQVAQLRSTN
jgi:predicted pyridoxine 5'-phosphate oxidase superfamily flavin-nucleotide-binding protein